MKQQRVYLTASAAVILAVGLLYLAFQGHAAGPDDEDPPEVTYVDTKSGETFRLASRTSPEENPSTGERTLVPGMYCSECKAWKAVGPRENRQIQRTNLKCPIHKIPLTSEPPEPD